MATSRTNDAGLYLSLWRRDRDTASSAAKEAPQIVRAYRYGAGDRSVALWSFCPLLLRPRVSRTCDCPDASRTPCVRDADCAADRTSLHGIGHSKRDDRA